MSKVEKETSQKQKKSRSESPVYGASTRDTGDSGWHGGWDEGTGNGDGGNDIGGGAGGE